jgi:hypothetical protein
MTPRREIFSPGKADDDGGLAPTPLEVSLIP